MRKSTNAHGVRGHVIDQTKAIQQVLIEGQVEKRLPVCACTRELTCHDMHEVDSEALPSMPIS